MINYFYYYKLHVIHASVQVQWKVDFMLSFRVCQTNVLLEKKCVCLREKRVKDRVKVYCKGMNGCKRILLDLWTKIKVSATPDVRKWKDGHKSAQQPGTISYEGTASQKILGMGDYAVVNSDSESLKIFALGSCVGLSLFTPTADVVGMVHIALPNSSSDTEKAQKYPGYYADTAIPAVIASMRQKGFTGMDKSLIAKLVGGAKTRADRNSHFEIGLKNILATKKKLMQMGITVAGEELGGTISRTIMAKPGKIEVTITNPDRGSWII